MNLNFIELNANAKINLTLEVLSRREDGYHELRMVMHSIGLYDTLRLERAERGVIEVECDFPLPESNTLNRAAALFAQETGCGGVRIRLKKRIPAEAGLGGGSADAAGVLHGMQLLYGKAEENRLYEIGRQVGADVPFCLHGGCALVRGIGERLTALAPASLPLLVVKGERGVSTGALFRSLDPSAMGGETHIAQGMMAALENGPAAVSGALSNALSPAAEGLVPFIAELRERLLDAGALGALMTGSGSAVFGVFESMEKARAAEALFSDCAFAAVCQTVPNPVEIIRIG